MSTQTAAAVAGRLVVLRMESPLGPSSLNNPSSIIKSAEIIMNSRSN